MITGPGKPDDHTGPSHLLVPLSDSASPGRARSDLLQLKNPLLCRVAFVKWEEEMNFTPRLGSGEKNHFPAWSRGGDVLNKVGGSSYEAPSSGVQGGRRGGCSPSSRTP